MAERHWNAHAFINIAVWLSVDGSGSSGNKTAAIITDARVVFGYPAAQDGVHFLRWQCSCPLGTRCAATALPKTLLVSAATHTGDTSVPQRQQEWQQGTLTQRASCVSSDWVPARVHCFRVQELRVQEPRSGGRWGARARSRRR